jgi:hypothetical protein
MKKVLPIARPALNFVDDLKSYIATKSTSSPLVAICYSVDLKVVSYRKYDKKLIKAYINSGSFPSNVLAVSKD